MTVVTLALATPQQLRDALQDQTVDDATCAQAIAMASSLVRSIARQDFDFVSQETVTLAGGGRELVLPQRPVVVDAQNPLTVAELPDIGAQAFTLTEGLHFRRVGDRLVKAWRTRWQPGQEYTLRDSMWARQWPTGIWAPWVQVTYSHGYTVAPAEVTTVVLSAAITYATNPQGLRSAQLDGEVTVQWAAESVRAPRELVDEIRKQLNAVGARRGGAFSIATTV